MNATAEKQSVLPDPREREVWGPFGYQGAMADRALRADDVAIMAECVERKFVSEETRTLYNDSLLHFADREGAVKVAKYLRSLGWRS